MDFVGSLSNILKLLPVGRREAVFRQGGGSKLGGEVLAILIKIF
jgi:hypothetical protein